MTDQIYNFTIDEHSDGLRLDVFLTEHIPGVSRTRISRDAERLLVNGIPQKASRKVRTGEQVEFAIRPPEKQDLIPEPVDFSVVHEDNHVLVVDKPAGLVVHPAAGNWSGTLVHGLLYRDRDMSDTFEGSYRPGIVHRLDKDTSGLIIIAKDPQTHEFLQSQFARRVVRKRYIAIVTGRPREARGTVSGYIIRDPKNRKRFTHHNRQGKEAVTEYRIAAAFAGMSLVELYPHTGRTHQLRVHMKHLGCPILGDSLYSRNRDPEGLMLHAAALQILLPEATEPTLFCSPLPERFTRCLQEHGAPKDVVERDWSGVQPVWLSEARTQERPR